MIITISGQYGSGGQEIAQAICDQLGYTMHGSDLMEKATANSGIDLHRSVLDFYDETDASIDNYAAPVQKALLGLELDVLPISRTEDTANSPRIQQYQSSFLANFMDTLPVNRRELPAAVTKKADVDRLKFAQAKAILDAAESGNAVFTGRCASYVLAGRPDVIRIFTTASMESCHKRICAVYGMDDDPKLDSFIAKTNMRRAYYYETFTDGKWDDPENYDYCINTDCLGFEGSLELVKKIIELKK